MYGAVNVAPHGITRYLKQGSVGVSRSDHE
jgi:hypothetical protein